MPRTIIIDDPAIARLAASLPRAAALGHSGRSFLEHLLCTWRILADWRMPAAVCRAGFMHSAYSTSFYPHALFRLEDRVMVRRMIGREAEDLVYRFCTMDRRGFWGQLAARRGRRVLTYPDRVRPGAPIRVSRRTLERLLLIESANVAEQSKAQDGGPAPWMSRLLCWWEFLDVKTIPLRVTARPRLTGAADKAAIDAYRQALGAPLRHATVLLEEAIRKNPWAAEPNILRALCALEAGDGRAQSHLSRGARLLSAWGTPWDKRLTVSGWTALSDRIENVALGRQCALPPFDLIRNVLEKRARGPRWLSV